MEATEGVPFVTHLHSGAHLHRQALPDRWRKFTADISRTDIHCAYTTGLRTNTGLYPKSTLL